jgi:hypothetical protein
LRRTTLALCSRPRDLDLGKPPGRIDPQYRFAGSDSDDIGNATNRSPFPMLHLLREASVERALQAFPDPAAIYETNQRTLRRLGPHGWAALCAQCLRDAGEAGGPAS